MNETFQFLAGNFPNKGSRYVYEIWEWGNIRKEFCHNYIQWLFPIDTKSSYNKNAPVITKKEIDALEKKDKETFLLIQSNMKISFEKMLKFYGFQIINNRISFGDAFYWKSLFWRTYRNHNYKRISRILRSLCLFKMEDYARQWFVILRELSIDNSCMAMSLHYWEAALVL